MIDENGDSVNSPNQHLYPGTPPPNQAAASSKDGLPVISSPNPDFSVHEPAFSTADPQGVEQDLNQLSQHMDQSQWRVLHKLHSSSMNHGREIEALQDQVGSQMTTTHYFLSGETEPQFYSNKHSLNENVLGLKNSSLRTRRSLDNHLNKYNQEIQLLKNAVTSLNNDKDVKSPQTGISSCPNACPNADEMNKYKMDCERIQADLKKELTRLSSLSSGSGFKALDLTARMVELENENRKLFQKWEITAKAVAVLKNERPSGNRDREGFEFDIRRLTERVEQLEKEDSDRHSRNLFSDLSDSKITLLEKEVDQLQKSVRFQLADSDTNQWLRQKQLSFLDTPDMNDKFKAQFRNFANTWSIQPKNLSREVRELMVKVSHINY